MIPKIIHYVWVGDRPKPALALKCIESWKKFCPDFEIMEWNNDIPDEIKRNKYVLQALEYKKWAFVSDYIRLYALYNHGGVYLDTDCEITASIGEFLKYAQVLGLEAYENDIPKKIATSFWGCEKGNEDIKKLMDAYENISFIKGNGELDLTANVHRLSDYFAQEYGFVAPYNNDKIFFFGNNGAIFPTNYFCKPKEGRLNFAIHHFAYSWRGDMKRTLLLQIGRYKLVKFTGMDARSLGGSEIRMLPSERMMMKTRIGKRYFCVTRRQKDD